MSKSSKLFFLSRTFPVWSTGLKFPGRCWVQQCSGPELASICLQALFRTRHWSAASAPAPIVCLFISLLLMVLPGKPQSLEPFEKLSECWHMPFKHGFKWILITPVIEQASKHLSANISQGHF